MCRFVTADTDISNAAVTQLNRQAIAPAFRFVSRRFRMLQSHLCTGGMIGSQGLQASKRRRSERYVARQSLTNLDRSLSGRRYTRFRSHKSQPMLRPKIEFEIAGSNSISVCAFSIHELSLSAAWLATISNEFMINQNQRAPATLLRLRRGLKRYAVIPPPTPVRIIPPIQIVRTWCEPVARHICGSIFTTK